MYVSVLPYEPAFADPAYALEALAMLIPKHACEALTVFDSPQGRLCLVEGLLMFMGLDRSAVYPWIDEHAADQALLVLDDDSPWTYLPLDAVTDWLRTLRPTTTPSIRKHAELLRLWEACLPSWPEELVHPLLLQEPEAPEVTV